MRKLYELCVLLGVMAVMPIWAGSSVSWIAQNPANNMNDPFNWSTGTLPASLDDAIFDSSKPNVTLNPLENEADFTVSTIQFPGSASAFTLHFENQPLTLTGAGITGANTNTTIDATNIDNSIFIGDQISFTSASASSGSAIVNVANSGTLTGTQSGSVASINSNLHSTGTFTIGSGGKITASNTGSDSTTGAGSNGISNTGGSQLQFDQSFTAGDNVTVSVSNSGIFSGTNITNGNAVSIVNGSQFLSSGVFQVGDNFNCELQNTGNDSGHGIGFSNIGQLNAAQMILQTTGSVGNNCRIALSNTGINSSPTTNYDFIGHLNDEQFFVGNAFQAGDNLSITTSNIGIDDSSGVGGSVVANIDSPSGSTGFQMQFNYTCTVGDNASFTAINSGIYTGSNTAGNAHVGTMNEGQIFFNGTLHAGNSFNLNVSNTGTDSSIGFGGDGVGGVSGVQAVFYSLAVLGDNATLTAQNSAHYSGSNSSFINSVGFFGSGQILCNDDFQTGNFFTLTANNHAFNAGTGSFASYVGSANNAFQVKFSGTCSLGDSAIIEIANSGTNSSPAETNVNVASLLSNQQLSVGDLFYAGNDLKITVGNSGYDDSLGQGGGSYVGAILSSPHGSQISFDGGCSLGDRASILVTNSGTYSGTNTVSGNNVGVLGGPQFYVGAAFKAEDFLNLQASNIGSDFSSGQGSNSIGTVGGSQIHYQGTCTVWDNATIGALNVGFYFGNNITASNSGGSVQDAQISFVDLFGSGDALNLSAFNIGFANNTGFGLNIVGTVINSQIQFANGCYLGNDAVIDIINAGLYGGSTIGSKIGSVGGSQLSVTGTFVAGSNLHLSATNIAINTGDPNNSVGTIGEYQIAFNDSVTVGDGSVISAYNSGSGTISNIGSGLLSQILFNQGFTINGKATIQAVNEGVFEGSGIQVLGNNSGGDAKIVLGNALLNINTSGPTFTIGELNGDSTSLVQSYPQLIINTDQSVNANFSGIIQDYSGTISSSSLVKTGVGTQILAGINTYTGLTTIQEGALVVNGSVVGNVNVTSLGALKGTGTIGGDVTNTGAIAPGQSIGTIHINGNFLNNGGNYDLEVDGSGNSDLIAVGETAAINGGIVIVSSPDNTYALYHRYTILSAAAITGSLYTDAIPLSALVNPMLSYDDTHVYVTLEADISRAAETHNQLAVAERLDGITNPNANQLLLLDEMVGLSVDNARSALDSLSGYQHTEDFWLAQTVGRQFIRRLYDPIRPIISIDRNECCDVCDECNNPACSIWLESGGDVSHLKGNKNAKGLSMNGYEVTAGVQNAVGCDATVGFAGSYESSRVHYDQGGSGKNNTVLAGVYGLYRPERFYGLIDLSYGYSGNKINRAIVVGALDYTARSKPNISQGIVYGEIGVDFHPGCIFMQVFGGVEGGRYWRNSVRESESHGWGLSIHKKNLSIVNSRLGVHLNANDLFCNSNLSLDVAWNKLLSSRKNSVDGRFIEFGDSYTIEGINFNTNSIDYALTLSSEFDDNWRGYLEFAGECWENLVTSNFLMGVEFSW